MEKILALDWIRISGIKTFIAYMFEICSYLIHGILYLYHLLLRDIVLYRLTLRILCLTLR